MPQQTRPMSLLEQQAAASYDRLSAVRRHASRMKRALEIIRAEFAATADETGPALGEDHERRRHAAHIVELIDAALDPTVDGGEDLNGTG